MRKSQNSLLRSIDTAQPVAFLVVLSALVLASCKATQPSSFEKKLAQESKEALIGGKEWKNPTPDSQDSVQLGAKHFQHHCQICHGLDGQNTGVPFSDKMSPAVADLTSDRVQAYTDGQLKWIVENGIRYTGMPGWKGILQDNEMWHIVRYVRHLPPKGSLGIPQVYQETSTEHRHEGTHEDQQREHTH